MAINFTDFTNAKQAEPMPIQESPWANVFENVLKGYKIAEEPRKMKREAEEKELSNSLKKAAIKLKEAQTAKANRPAGAGGATAAKGALAAAFQIRSSLDPNSPTYQSDLDKVNAYITNLATHGGAIPLAGQGGASGSTQGVKVELPGGKVGYMPPGGKEKVGTKPVYDESGGLLGYNVPLDAKQSTQYKAKAGFDVIYPFLNKSFGQYSDRGGYERFISDIHNYKKDAAAKARIDNARAGWKLLSIGTTTENARIGGHATNVQLEELKSSLESSGIGPRLKRIAEFGLPGKSSIDAGKIFKSYVDKVDEVGKSNVPAYEFRAINPNAAPSSNSQDNDPLGLR